MNIDENDFVINTIFMTHQKFTQSKTIKDIIY
jgi:hypothetical protein